MKISLLCFDLSHNCLGRPYVLAQVLKRKYDVEIIGPAFRKGIWKPCDTVEIPYKLVKGCNYPFFAFSAQKILKHIDGDVIYAFKPRPTSFGLGLIKKLRREIPLVLDIDDWEVGFYLNQSKWRLLVRSLLTLKAPNNFLYTVFLEYLTCFAESFVHITKSTFPIRLLLYLLPSRFPFKTLNLMRG